MSWPGSPVDSPFIRLCAPAGARKLPYHLQLAEADPLVEGEICGSSLGLRRSARSGLGRRHEGRAPVAFAQLFLLFLDVEVEFLSCGIVVILYAR